MSKPDCHRRARLSAWVGALALITACSSGTSITTLPPGVVQHLYVGDDNVLGALRVYTLPLTNASEPIAAISLDEPFTLGANATTLAVTGLSGNTNLFALPLDAGTEPFATITQSSDGTPLFTPNGSLYYGGSGGINVYTPPFSDQSAPSSTISTGNLSPAYLAIDSSGRVYVGSGGNQIGVISGTSLVTTFSAPAGTQFRGMAATGTQLFACGFSGQSNNIYIYPLPLTTASIPAVTINLGAVTPEGCAVDAAGDLYVGSPNGELSMFIPPFTAASTPAVIIATAADIFGLTVGP